jgi:hypothetical protein
MFSKQYPAIHYWIENFGTIEFGEDDVTHSLIRILDDEGLLYEDRVSATFNESIVEIEAFLKDYFWENHELKI